MLILPVLLLPMSDELEQLEFGREIDLHHFHPRDIKEILSDFLDHAEDSGYDAVRIIHGKGRSVTKTLVHDALKVRDSVTGFGDDGGNWGVTVASLRKSGPV